MVSPYPETRKMPIGLRQIQEAIGRELAACYKIEHQLPDRLWSCCGSSMVASERRIGKAAVEKDQSRPQPFLFGRLIGRSTTG